jgi:type II secretory pathway component GspD/PulD (secretin)
MHPKTLGVRAQALARLLLPLTLVAAPLTAAAQKVCDNLSHTQCSELREKQSVLHTFYLPNVSQQNDANEVLVAIRNIIDPSVKLYLVTHDNAIVMRAFPEEIDMTQKIIDDLTRPQHPVHLHFTLRTLDGTRLVNSEQYDMTLAPGERAQMKQGRKVPVITGTVKNGEGLTSQYTYLDVGANFDVTLLDTGKGFDLKAKVERSSIGSEPLLNGIEPVVHQSVMDGFIALAPGQTTELGRADIDGTTQHIEVDVTADAAS